MKQNDIKELPQLRNENYENIFNVYTDDDGSYFYNLLQSITIPSDLPAGYFVNYNITYGDTWPYISYKAYYTPNLWWLIATINNITNPTALPTPGTTIKLLKVDVVKQILAQISTQ